MGARTIADAVWRRVGEDARFVEVREVVRLCGGGGWYGLEEGRVVYRLYVHEVKDLA